MELYSNPYLKNRATHKEERLQIDELDKWRAHVKKKPKAHDESKQHHDERKNERKQFKVGDKVLLDGKDHRIATLELNTNGVTPFTVLNVFPYVRSRSLDFVIHCNHTNERNSDLHGLDTPTVLGCVETGL
ncbi:hypothetical protein GOBAR_AA04560 [Gossypium barbadense]|uniref:Uncharacterized protein n=1 Tax=Gossypium barbadense TaxID=3634 RepID=A0A2P5YK75_GOSBA|nr:hypothetical protein GOBAR_AA04560 [Gossypium barbadense]